MRAQNGRQGPMMSQQPQAQQLQAQQPQAQQQQAPAFALGLGQGNNILDFLQVHDVKTYYKAIALLPTEDCFDGTMDKVVVFLATVEDCSSWFNWTAILMIPDDNTTPRDLIREYGCLSMTNCQAHAGTYIDQPMRQAQNSQMLYTFLIESITPSFKGQVLLYQTNYTINNTKSGPCSLKQILSLTYINTRAKAFHI